MASINRAGRLISPAATVADNSRSSSNSVSLAVASRRARKALFLPFIADLPRPFRRPQQVLSRHIIGKPSRPLLGGRLLPKAICDERSYSVNGAGDLALPAGRARRVLAGGRARRGDHRACRA